MDVRALLEKLRIEIDEETLALEKKREFVEFLRVRVETEERTPLLVMTPATNTALLNPGMSAVQAFSDGLAGKTSMHRVINAQRTNDTSFKRIVERYVRVHGHAEFTTNDVYEGLNERGDLVSPERRSVITTILSRMAESGELERTVAGAGSIPNKYRLKGHTESLPLNKETTNE